MKVSPRGQPVGTCGEGSIETSVICYGEGDRKLCYGACKARLRFCQVGLVIGAWSSAGGL